VAEAPGAFTNEFLTTLKELSPKAQRYGQGFGQLAPGFAANFTVLNFTPYTVTKTTLKTKVGHSPFEGITFPGSVRAVFVLGDLLK
jgi:dihydroorotase